MNTYLVYFYGQLEISSTLYCPINKTIHSKCFKLNNFIVDWYSTRCLKVGYQDIQFKMNFGCVQLSYFTYRRTDRSRQYWHNYAQFYTVGHFYTHLCLNVKVFIKYFTYIYIYFLNPLAPWPKLLFLALASTSYFKVFLSNSSIFGFFISYITHFATHSNHIRQWFIHSQMDKQWSQAIIYT